MREDADINSSTPLRFAHSGVSNSDELTALLEKAGLTKFVLPLAGPAAPDEEDEGEDRDLLAVQRLLHGGGLTRPLLCEAAESTDAKEGLPKVLSLLAFTTATVDMRTLEQLSRAACALAAVKLGLQTP